MIDAELKEKINNYFTNRILGNALLFSDEEKSELYDEVGFILRRVGAERGETIRKQDYMAIMTALVELTKEWFSDENSWLGYISRKILGSQEEIKGKIYTQICKCIDELAEEGKIFILDCFQKKYYTTVCSHAFSPKNSLFSFFDLCWEIYCKDLFQQYVSHDSILSIILISLNKKFSSTASDNDEDITIGSKVYSIRAGIRGLVFIKDSSIFIELLDNILCAIHSFMNNEPVRKCTYLDILLDEWWRTKESQFGLRTERKTPKRIFIATVYSQIKPRYFLENGIARLIIPSIRLKDQFDCEPCIEIKNQDRIIISETIPTFGSGIIMTTKELSYPLDKLVDDSFDISITVFHGEKTIFQSHKMLYRSFIVFGENREIISQSLLPGIYFLYAIQNIKTPKDIQRQSKNLYCIAATDGEIICSSERIVFFESEKRQRDLFFIANEKTDLVYKKGDVFYKIIDGDLFLDINNKTNITDLGIRYDECIFKLSEFEPSGHNESYRFNLSDVVKPGEAVTVSVFRYSDNSILNFANIIKFNNISMAFDKPLYYGSKTKGKINFKTERYDIKGEFDILYDECSLPFFDGELQFAPPTLRWIIAPDDWNITPNHPIYYKDISNSALLEIDIPFGTQDYQVELSTGKAIEPEKNKHLYPIGRLIHSLKESDINENPVTLSVNINNTDYELIKFYLREAFSDDPVFVRSEKYEIEWNPTSFIGEKECALSIEILDPAGRIIDQRKIGIQKSEVLTFGSLEENYYIVSVSLQKKGFWAKKRELFRKKIFFGNIKNIRFKNKRLKISEAKLFDKPTSEKISPFYIEEIVYLGNKEGFDYYSGRIFTLNKYSEKKYIDYINTPKGDRIRIQPIRMELKTLSSFYLGYGLLENDPEFEFDSEFVIDREGMLTVDGCCGKKPQLVDYFIIEA